MSSRGHLVLTHEDLRKLIGLPPGVEILGFFPDPQKESLRIRLASPQPVDGLTWETRDGGAIAEIAPEDYLFYLGNYYDAVCSAVENTGRKTQPPIPMGEEGD